MKVSKIKLFETKPTGTGTRRFQSQLYIGRDAANFIMREDRQMLIWSNGNKGFDFYPFEGEYEIVQDAKQMQTQIL